VNPLKGNAYWTQGGTGGNKLQHRIRRRGPRRHRHRCQAERGVGQADARCDRHDHHKAGHTRDPLHVFERAVSVGKELPDGTVPDRNYVWLSDWQLENINNNYLMPVDLETYRYLKNRIAKALVPLL
jgi:hypothetical protein